MAWFLVCRGLPAYQLPNTWVAAGSNVAVLQLTGALPFTLEVAFLGGPTGWQKPIREPVTASADCASEGETQPESVSDRAKALQGRTSSRCATPTLALLTPKLGFRTAWAPCAML